MNKKRARRFCTAKETGRNSLRDSIHEWMESKEREDDFVVTPCVSNRMIREKYGNTLEYQSIFLWSQN